MSGLAVPMRDRTLPAASYHDPAIYERERDLVFGTAWQLAGFSADVAEPGSYVTAVLGDREFLITRDAHGVLRAFHNVCPHRGAALASGCARRQSVQCSYHGWTYGLDGGLRRAPGMDAAAAGVRLREVSVLERDPLLFVSPASDPPPFDEQFGDLLPTLAADGLDLADVARGARRVTRSFEIAANWKVVMENSLECYHCGIAHPGIADSLDLDGYRHHLEPWWSVQGAPMRGAPRGDESALGASSRQAAASSGGHDFARFVFLYPNAFLEVYPGGASFSALIVRPLTVERTRSEHVKFLSSDVTPAEEVEFDAFVEQVIREDIDLCERVQRGLRSGAVEHGILNLDGPGANEACIGHFDALVANALDLGAG